VTLLEVLAAVRTALKDVAPAFIRDAVPRVGGVPQLPDRCIIIDLITDSTVRDFTSVYNSILVQVGCWAPSIAQALDDLEAARVTLEAHELKFDLVRVNAMQTDEQYRGVTADFTTLY